MICLLQKRITKKRGGFDQLPRFLLLFFSYLFFFVFSFLFSAGCFQLLIFIFLSSFPFPRTLCLLFIAFFSKNPKHDQCHQRSDDRTTDHIRRIMHSDIQSGDRYRKSQDETRNTQPLRTAFINRNCCRKGCCRMPGRK